MQLNERQRTVLGQMADGAVLKVHRDLDGTKRYLLHPLDGQAITIEPGVVAQLKRRKLISSNQKFPTSTYLLTEKALGVLEAPREDGANPVTPRDFADDSRSRS